MTTMTAPILHPAAAAAKVLALMAADAKPLDINAAKAELMLSLTLAGAKFSAGH